KYYLHRKAPLVYSNHRPEPTEKPMASIDVDFDVFKALTVRRQTETMTYNDVIRELLKLPATAQGNAVRPLNGRGPGWVQKGVTFPNGTELRVTYKGKTYVAQVANNQMIFDGEAMTSLSEAANRVTRNSVNGWRFWECRFPGETEWRLADSLKN